MFSSDVHPDGRVVKIFTKISVTIRRFVHHIDKQRFILINGDSSMTEQEFKETVLPHHAMMLAEAIRLLKNRDEALDCLQDSVTSLWKSRWELAKVGNIKAYCIRSVTNRALGMIRQRRNTCSEYSNDLPGDITPVSSVERRENVEILRKAIKLLPENERKVVLMKAINGMSGDEIAEATGFTISNVRVLLYRGRKRIKDYLKNMDYDGKGFE